MAYALEKNTGSLLLLDPIHFRNFDTADLQLCILSRKFLDAISEPNLACTQAYDPTLPNAVDQAVMFAYASKALFELLDVFCY